MQSIADVHLQHVVSSAIELLHGKTYSLLGLLQLQEQIWLEYIALVSQPLFNHGQVSGASTSHQV